MPGLEDCQGFGKKVPVKFLEAAFQENLGVAQRRQQHLTLLRCSLPEVAATSDSLRHRLVATRVGSHKKINHLTYFNIFQPRLFPQRDKTWAPNLVSDSFEKLAALMIDADGRGVITLDQFMATVGKAGNPKGEGFMTLCKTSRKLCHDYAMT